MGRLASWIPRCLGFMLVVSHVAGCSGSATVRFVSLHATEIDPPPTTEWRYDAQECYWWIDEAGELNIALRCRQQSVLLGKYGRVDLDMSWVLGDPPAGSGRNYNIRGRETRTRFLSALHDLRLTSYRGIVAVTAREDGTLKGSFRIWMSPRAGVQFFSFLPQRPGPLLCSGSFHAVRDEKRGTAIRTYCESNGWARPPRKQPRSTTQPRQPP